MFTIIKTNYLLSVFTTAGHIGPVNTLMTSQYLSYVLNEQQRTSAFIKQTAKTYQTEHSTRLIHYDYKK